MLLKFEAEAEAKGSEAKATGYEAETKIMALRL